MPALGTVFIHVKASLKALKTDFQKAHAFVSDGAKKLNKIASTVTFGHPALALAALGTTGVYALKRLGESSINVAADFETMQIKLNALTSGKGAETLERINKWALDMPVNTQEATRSFVTMQAMGLDPTIEKMQALTDVAAVLGEEALGRVSLALGQMASMQRLSAQDLNQLAQVGISSRKILQDAFGMSVADIQKSGIKMEKILDAFWMHFKTKFGGAAKAAMKSWSGLVVRFKGYFVEIQRQVMDAGLFQFLKDELENITESMKTWLESNQDWIKNDLPKEIKTYTIMIKDLTILVKDLTKLMLMLPRVWKTMSNIYSMEGDFGQTNMWSPRYNPNYKEPKANAGKIRDFKIPNYLKDNFGMYGDSDTDYGAGERRRLAEIDRFRRTAARLKAQFALERELKAAALKDSAKIALDNVKQWKKPIDDVWLTFEKGMDSAGERADEMLDSDWLGNLNKKLDMAVSEDPAFKIKDMWLSHAQGIEAAAERSMILLTEMDGMSIDEYDKFIERLELKKEAVDTISASMGQAFNDFFFDVLQNNMKSFEDYWDGFLKSLNRSIAQFLADETTNKFMDFLSLIIRKIGSGGINWGGGGFTMGSGGGYGGRALGGSIDEHVIGFGTKTGNRYELGENGSEGILPMNRVTRGIAGGFGGAPQNVIINIENNSGQQIESESTRRIDGENLIINTVISAIQTNKGGIRSYVGAR